MPATLTLEPPVRDGQTLDYEELRQEAADAVEAARKRGRTQVQLAEELDVAQATLSRALSTPGAKYAALQRRVVALLTRYEIEDSPLFRVRRKS